MDVDEIAHEPETPLVRWSAEEFIEFLSEGIVADRRIELLDGLMVKEMPQGEIHSFIFLALQQAFAALGAVESGLRVNPTLVLGANGVVEPEFALLRQEAQGRFGLPRESDVLWTIEVSVTSRRKDLTEKKAAYASAGIPHYWVFDGVRRGVWTFSEPREGDYVGESFYPAGEIVTLPVLGGRLDMGVIFPPLDAA